jgi:hypothetical protein
MSEHETKKRPRHKAIKHKLINGVKIYMCSCKYGKTYIGKEVE